MKNRHSESLTGLCFVEVRNISLSQINKNYSNNKNVFCVGGVCDRLNIAKTFGIIRKPFIFVQTNTHDVTSSC